MNRVKLTICSKCFKAKKKC